MIKHVTKLSFVLAIALFLLVSVSAASAFEKEVLLEDQVNLHEDGACGRSSIANAWLDDCNTKNFKGSGPGGCKSSEATGNIGGCYFWQPENNPKVTAQSKVSLPESFTGSLTVFTAHYGGSTYNKEEVNVFVNGVKLGRTDDNWCNLGQDCKTDEECQQCENLGPHEKTFEKVKFNEGKNRIEFQAVSHGGSVYVYKYIVSSQSQPDSDNDAECISITIPSTITAGETKEVSITVRNTGETTWKKSNDYKLGSHYPANNLLWGINRVELKKAVEPGEKVKFTFDITAPQVPGIYSNFWGMLQENTEWFGDICGKLVHVKPIILPCTPGQIDSQNCNTGLLGVCADGYSTRTCQPDGQWGSWSQCQIVTAPTPEICNNNLDEDCDGLIDEGCGSQQCSPPGLIDSRVCNTGLLGECSDGYQIRTCLANNLWSPWGQCQLVTDPTSEICNNGRDEDCDGQIDEGCGSQSPVLNIPDRTINEDSGINNNLVDLHQYTYDADTQLSQLTYSITSQSNQDVVYCSLDSNRFIDCTTKPNQNGYSDITVRVSDSEHLTTDVFRVNVLPVADNPMLSLVKSSACQGNSASFKVETTDPDNLIETIEWDFGDNSEKATGKEVKHVYSSDGKYTVSIAAKDKNNNIVASLSQEIKVSECVVRNIEISNLFVDDYYGIRPGDDLQVYLKIKNLGNVKEKVTLKASIDDTSITSQDAVSFNINDMDGKWHILSLKLPSDLPKKEYAVKVTAVSKTDSAAKYMAFRVE